MMTKRTSSIRFFVVVYVRAHQCKLSNGIVKLEGTVLIEP